MGPFVLIYYILEADTIGRGFPLKFNTLYGHHIDCKEFPCE